MTTRRISWACWAALATSVVLAVACAATPPPPLATAPAPSAEPPAPPAAPPPPVASSSGAPLAPAKPPEPAPATAAGEPAPKPPAEDAVPPIEATIVGRRGTTAMLKVATPVKVGQKAVLFRFADMVLLAGWIEIADVTVTQTHGDTVAVRIDEDKSKIEINGKHVDHYVAGTKARLSLKPAPKAD